MPMFIVVLSCFPLGSPATVYYSIRSVTDLGWFPLEMSHCVCCCPQLLFPFLHHVWIFCGPQTVSSWFPPWCLFILVLSHFPLGSLSCLPWLSSVIFALVPHHVCSFLSCHFPLGSQSCLSMVVLSCVPRGSPPCLSIIVLIFPLVPCLFIIVLSGVPLGSSSVYRCPHLCSPWFPIGLSLSSFVFPLVSHHVGVHFSHIPFGFCVPVGSPSVYRCPQLCSPWFLMMYVFIFRSHIPCGFCIMSVLVFNSPLV